MANKKNSKKSKVYVVFSYENTGSGSLTYPEDFDFVKAFTDPLKAETFAAESNKANGVPTEDEDGDEIDDVDCIDTDQYDGTIHTVIPLDLED